MVVSFERRPDLVFSFKPSIPSLKNFLAQSLTQVDHPASLTAKWVKGITFLKPGPFYSSGKELILVSAKGWPADRDWENIFPQIWHILPSPPRVLIGENFYFSSVTSSGFLFTS